MLIMSRSNLESDPRVIRQLETFNKEYEIHTIARGANPKYEENFTPVDQIKFEPPTGLLALPVVNKYGYYRAQVKYTGDSGYYKDLLRKKFWNRELKEIVNNHGKVNYDIIICNDYNTLPLAIEIRGSKETPILFDSHEYFLDEHGDNSDWVQFTKPTVVEIANRYLKKVDSFLNVSWGISEMFEKEFGMKSEVVPNSPTYKDLNVQEAEDGKIKLIHHGMYQPNRKLEDLAKMVDSLDDRFSLDLMIKGKLPQSLKDTVNKSQKVRFVDPVPFAQITQKINEYDISVIFYPPVNLNLKFALPNKFFESIQGRLAIALGPDGEMHNFAKKYDLGIYSSSYDFKDLGKSLSELTTDRLNELKNNSHKAAEIEHFGTYQKVLYNEVQRISKN